MNQSERHQLIDSLIEGAITEADFLRLEAEFSVDPSARQEYYDRLTLSALLEVEAAATTPGIVKQPLPATASRWPAYTSLAAACVAVASLLGLLYTQLRPAQDTPTTIPPLEQNISGFGVLTGQARTVWKTPVPTANGSLVPAGALHLLSGIAQIELFSGVTVVIEGEAEFQINSPMDMVVTRGKVRARVPTPAHGFRIRTHGGDVVDLGTEFALNISPTQSEVHVLDGEIEWHPLKAEQRHMEKGEALRWDDKGVDTKITANAASFVGITELGETLANDRQSRLSHWQKQNEIRQQDSRLIALYQMGRGDPMHRRLPNTARATAAIVQEGAIVAATKATDRWGRPESALDFSPTGSRVRLTIPGDYRSLTLLCWVKINSLDRWYNSLFLTDGHELHEPHWQIMDDGRLFFSVKKREGSAQAKGKPDKHIFYSPAFWTASMSGQWQMLATVYDVDARRVTHFLNGRQLSEETIPDEYLVETVQIGAASLGNWGMPNREDARFAVRNLNGSMDEFSLYAAALPPQEIAQLFENGRP